MTRPSTPPRLLSILLGLTFLAFGPLALEAGAQVVTYEPAFPTEERPVTIYFHADRGTGGLKGYTGDVYAHTGVLTNRGSGWQHVKTQWGENTPATRLERIETDLYRLHIPDVRAYYNVTDPNEVVQSLAFVFRSGAPVNGSYLEGKDTGARDIFVSLYSTGLNVRVAQPVTGPLNPIVAPADTTIQVVVVASSASSPLVGIRLLSDGTEVAQTTNDTLRYALPLLQPGRVDLLAVATAEDGSVDSTAFYAVRNPAVVEAAFPAGFEDGINYHADDAGRVTLALFAPRKEFVYVIGDFNDWEVDPAYLMNRDAPRADSVRYWLTIDGLEPGREYAFQYLVDGTLRLADLFSTKVLVPGADESIPASAYPDLKPYPTGKTSGIVSILQTGQAPFAFTPFERPEQKDLVIYELLLRDFLAAHDFDTLADTLDYLDRLGITAIELMPVSEYSGNESWGYNPDFHLALDKYYGRPEDFKRFVDEAHQRGIAVLLDVVYNHAHDNSPLVQLYGPTAANPYINLPAKHPFNVFYDLNHENTYVQYWLDRANDFWIEEYNIDGYRFDLAGGIMQRGNFFGRNDNRIALLTRMMGEVWEEHPDAYLILENLIESTDEWAVLTNYGKAEGLPGGLVWHNMNRPYNQATMGYLAANDFSSNLRATYPPFLDSRLPVENVVTYMESHDEQWLMYRNLNYGRVQGAYNIKSLSVALDRQKLAGAFFLTVPGPRMLWQFSELGYGGGPDECLRPGDGTAGECPSTAPGRVDRKPIRWEYQNDPLRQKLYKTWAALLRLRNENELFTSPETQVQMRVGQGQPDRWIKLSNPALPEGEVRHAVVVGNFDVAERDVAVDFPAAGTWYDFVSGRLTEVSGTGHTLRMLPGEFRIYTDRQVEPMEPGLVTTDSEEEDGGRPGAVTLEPNVPNPFHGETTIAYTLTRSGPVRLAVYDLLGREVALLGDGVRPEGRHEVRLDGLGLGSGTYLYRLEAEGRVLTAKMTLMR